jgi:hypothetical protein
MVKKCIIQVSQSKNVKNAVMEAILKEIELEVRAQKKLKTSERSSAYSAMDTILKKTQDS